jgi:N-acetylated-alpha-linked acidic dipeptidase
LANASIIPYRVTRYARDLKTHFENATAQAKALNPSFESFEETQEALVYLQSQAQKLHEQIADHREMGKLNSGQIQQINNKLLQMEKKFLFEEGMPFGSWYRSLYASSDPFSGYASWILPGIQYELEQKNTDRLNEWDSIYAEAISSLSKNIMDIIQHFQYMAVDIRIQSILEYNTIIQEYVNRLWSVF